MAAVPARKIEAAEALLAAHPAPKGEGGWAREARAAAAARLRKMGAPIGRDEYWKWTDPSALTAPEAPSAPLHPAGPAIFADRGALVVTFVDGMLRRDLSDDLSLEGAEICTLEEALAADIHWAKEVFGVLEARGQDPVARPLAAFNTAVAGQGLAIRATGKVSRPVLIKGARESESSDALLHHVVKLEEGAELTVLETGGPGARVNSVLEVEIADRAAFHQVRAHGPEAERRGAWHLFARLGTESVCKTFSVAAGGRLTRIEQVAELTGDDAAVHLAGACLGEGRDFVHDDTVFVTHDALNCESRQVFKKVLRDQAKGIFQGKILVKPGAQKTDGYQISQGLLLDEHADFLAKPELEIYADDVVCSHGSTCGAADEDALYYLRARGIPKREAENMLVMSFLGQAVEEIESDDLAEEMRERIAQWVMDDA
ncbi:SufD family Fe-S cluster assembly protein [uncultured Albimonas sp.]|uniref:SufB/SufD family protein n=1 Tax=uncultured Albimonas sp. TaxID=1331701 RepID=UPI0030EB1F68|tara:strand:+ start:5388 stop:6677 length:1290 start_codon:yes stop_codon:yes gene_type:complete